MKKFAIVLALSASFFPFNQAHAQAALAEKIGTKLLTSILGSVIGKEVNSIFGDKTLTVEDVAKGINEGFAANRVKSVEADVKQLRAAVASYNELGSTDTRNRDIGFVFNRIATLEGNIEDNMSRKNFWKLLPNYIMTQNVKLAFDAEQHLVDPKGNWDKALAKSAVNALKNVRDYVKNDFVDTARHLCIVKHSNQQFFNQSGSDIGPAAKSRSLSRLYGTNEICFTLLMVSRVDVGVKLKYFVTPSGQFFKDFRVFKNPSKHLYYFTMVKLIGRKQGRYTLWGPYSTEKIAEATRFRRAGLDYGWKFGDILEPTRNWRRMVNEVGTHAQRQEARKYTQELGAGG